MCNNEGTARVTIKDVARRAGVSHSTVSRSLNDSSLISGPTKERVRKIAMELGFEFNASARSLSTRRTGTVGIIYPELFDEFRNSLYADLLISGIRRILERDQLDSLGVFPRNSITGGSNIQRLIKQKKVDGLLLIHSTILREDWDFIRSSGTPHVLLHYRPREVDPGDSDYIFTDNIKGGFTAAESLIKAGCRKILCFKVDSYNQEMQDRTTGFQQAMEAYGLELTEEDILEGECYFHVGHDQILALGERIRDYDGIFAEADLIALGVIEALKEQGISVPGDIRVVGYDDIELGNYYRPRLTTVHQPRETQTELACRRLVARLDGAPPYPLMQEIVAPTMVFRESC